VIPFGKEMRLIYPEVVEVADEEVVENGPSV
jgi:hypothetical protein